MKLYIFILTLIVSSTLLAQKKDTVFLKREIAENPYPLYHAIFIDTSSKYGALFTRFNFSDFDSATYFGELEGLKSLKSIKADLNNFPKRWIALYKLKDQYYLYKPSDFGNHFCFEITDSTTIDYTMEGPEPSRLDNISFTSPTHAIIHRTNHWKGKEVVIQLIDAAKGIAVFTFSKTIFNKQSSQILMVDAAKAQLFSAVINYCQTDKRAEFEFDKIDFKLLVK